MVDTHNKMTIYISAIQKKYSIRNRGQLIVAISRTWFMENKIFFGSKAEKISTMKRVLTHRTQCCDYVDEVFNMITINSDLVLMIT